MTFYAMLIRKQMRLRGYEEESAAFQWDDFLPSEMLEIRNEMTGGRPLRRPLLCTASSGGKTEGCMRPAQISDGSSLLL